MSMPARSPAPGVAGISRLVRMATAIPIGTLTRKIQCQLRRSVRTPPSSTPMLPPPAMQNPNTPSAFVALAGIGEEAHDQRERDRRDDGAAEPLHRPRADQHPLARREPADDRGGGEERDPEQEQPALPEQVAEPAAEQQEPAEGEQVRVHHPRERRLGEAEIVGDRRQGDVHDRRRRRRSSGRPGRGRGGRSSVRVGCRGSSGLLSVSTCSTRRRAGISSVIADEFRIVLRSLSQYGHRRERPRADPGLPRPARAAPPPRRAVPAASRPSCATSPASAGSRGR